MMKKIASMLMTILFISAILFSASVQTAALSRLKGDTDDDGSVTILDATAIQRLLASIITDDDGTISRYGDINGDGLTILDATAIQRYLVEFDNEHHIGEPFADNPDTPVVKINGQKITIDGATFDTSGVPDELLMNDSATASKILTLIQSGNVEPNQFKIQVNNGVYDCKVDYTDERFKENYLMKESGHPAMGYDCLVRNDEGEEAAWVDAHYEGKYAYPFRVMIVGLIGKQYTFPIEFWYKGVLIKRCMVTVDLDETYARINYMVNESKKIEDACWAENMTDKEKLKAFSVYAADHYTYGQVICNTGAELVAFAARDLELTSMLLYPGGEANQQCERHLITYNIYSATTVPGGHCACLVIHEDGTVLRYDVQGGGQSVRVYNDPYNIFQ